jgi:hypothetical protein
MDRYTEGHDPGKKKSTSAEGYFRKACLGEYLNLVRKEIIVLWIKQSRDS